MPHRALATAANEGRFEQEGWRVRKDGTPMWAHVIIDPIRDPSGTLIGFAKITWDISAQKADREALRQSEERFRLLVQGAHRLCHLHAQPGRRGDELELGCGSDKGLHRGRDRWAALLPLLH
ncbi:PAS domain-containing protein [Methylobacterium phyllosphaerae]